MIETLEGLKNADKIATGLKTALDTTGTPPPAKPSPPGPIDLDTAAIDKALGPLRPDVAIIDISMPVLNGVDAARELKKSSPKTKVILLTQHSEDQYVTESLRA